MSTGGRRDRDAAGRARNSRPRDALGRPLPRGADGVEQLPDDLVFPPEDALAEAQRLLDDGRAFSAHEVLESAWKAAPDPERELWRGLAQLAVGLTHVQRGNPVGAVQLLRRAADRIAGYVPGAPYRIDVVGLTRWARAQADRIERDGLDAAAGDRPPRLTAEIG
jgi:uncharacterized membrane-anchored protein